MLAAASSYRRLIVDGLAGERNRLLLWTPVCVGVGIAIYFSLPAEPSPWLGAMATLVLALATAIAAVWVRRGRAAVVVVLAAPTLVAVGFAAAQVRTASVATTVLARPIGPTTVTGRAVITERSDERTRITLDRPVVDRLDPSATPRRVRLRLRGDQPTITPGDWVRARAMLSPLPPPAQPDAFDFQRQAFFVGIGATGFALGRVSVDGDATATDRNSGALRIARVRQIIADRVQAHVDGDAGAIVAALIVGDRSRISRPTIEAIRDAGLAHLLAISGLHIGLVAGSVFVALRLLAALSPETALRWPVKKAAAVVATAVAGIYMLLAGASVPTQRAFLMIAIVFLAVVLDRRGISMRLVAVAALVILLIHPEALLGASFQLSFAAVIALVAVYEAQAARLPLVRDEGPAALGVLRYPLGIAVTTIIATLATAPLAAFHFNQVAWYGIAANVVGVPLTALWTMPWAVVAVLLMPLNLEALGLIPMSWGVHGLIAIAKGVAAWPGALSGVPAMPKAALIAWVVGGLWLTLWRRRWRWLGGIGFAVALALILTAKPPDILADGSGRLLAIRLADDRLALSSATPAFTAESWLHAAGHEGKAAPWPKLGPGADGALSCDPFGCQYRRDGLTVAFVLASEAIDDACRTADVVIGVVPIRSPCPVAGPVIDAVALKRLGTHALWLDPPSIRVVTVGDRRGQRPWIPKPPQRD